MNMDMVVNRLRFPKVISIARRLFGEIAVVVIEEMALHGRLKIAQICKDCASRLLASAKSTTGANVSAAIAGADGADGAADGGIVEHEEPDVEAEEERAKLLEAEVLKVFEQLVQRRLIVPVPPLDIRKRLVERAAKNAQTLERLGRAAGAVNGAGGGSKPGMGSGSNGSAGAGAVSSNGSGSGASSSAGGGACVANAGVKRKRKDAAFEEPAQELPVELRMMLAANPEAQEQLAAAEASAGARKISRNNMAMDAPSSAMAGAAGTGAAVGGRGRGRGRGRGAAARGDKGGGGAVVPNLQEWTANATAVGSLGLGSSGSGVGGVRPLGGDFGPREDVLWTIGWEQYVREERHKLCTTMVRDRMEKVAGGMVYRLHRLSLCLYDICSTDNRS
jgi:hypothetical protein